MAHHYYRVIWNYEWLWIVRYGIPNNWILDSNLNISKWSQIEIGENVFVVSLFRRRNWHLPFSSNSANLFVSYNEHQLALFFVFFGFCRLRLNNKNHLALLLNALLGRKTNPQWSTHSGWSTIVFLVRSPFNRWRPQPHRYFTLRFGTQRFVQLQSRMWKEPRSRNLYWRSLMSQASKRNDVVGCSKFCARRWKKHRSWMDRVGIGIYRSRFIVFCYTTLTAWCTLLWSNSTVLSFCQ